MTKLQTASIGSYPRVGEDKDQQRYRRARGHFERKEISAHAFRDVEQSVTQEVMNEQLETGIDEITDGLIAWQDPISHFCKNVKGILYRGIARYFDTNFYYTIPLLPAKPKLGAALTGPEFKFAQENSPKPVRAVLTGPFTLAWHSQSDAKVFSKLSARLDFFRDVINQEIVSLKESGAKLVQIDEPALALAPDQVSLAKKTYTQLFLQQPDTRFILALYHNSVLPLYSDLHGLPFQGFNLDLTKDSKKLLDKILSEPLSALMGFGFINATTVQLEEIEPIVQYLRSWLSKHSNAQAYITPSSGLELLTRPVAKSKLQLLTRIQQELK